MLDFVDFVVHVFHPSQRDFYQLERLWGDAPRLALAALVFGKWRPVPTLFACLLFAAAAFVQPAAASQDSVQAATPLQAIVQPWPQSVRAQDAAPAAQVTISALAPQSAELRIGSVTVQSECPS